MIFVTAMAQRGVVGEGFQIVALPAARDSAKFLIPMISGYGTGYVSHG
jgi:hypothetical protein